MNELTTWKDVANAVEKLRQTAWEYCRYDDDKRVALLDFNDKLDKCVSFFHDMSIDIG